MRSIGWICHTRADHVLFAQPSWPSRVFSSLPAARRTQLTTQSSPLLLSDLQPTPEGLRCRVLKDSPILANLQTPPPSKNDEVHTPPDFPGTISKYFLRLWIHSRSLLCFSPLSGYFHPPPMILSLQENQAITQSQIRRQSTEKRPRRLTILPKTSQPTVSHSLSNTFHSPNRVHGFRKPSLSHSFPTTTIAFTTPTLPPCHIYRLGMHHVIFRYRYEKRNYESIHQIRPVMID